jgi:DNA-binding FrmR family transcriptional regulator
MSASEAVGPVVPPGTDAPSRAERALRAAEERLRAVRRMLADDHPCDEALAEIAAAQEVLRSLASTVAALYAEQCLARLSREQLRAELERTFDLLAHAGQRGVRVIPGSPA